MEQMRKQAEHVGTEIISRPRRQGRARQRPFRLTGDRGDRLHLRRADHRHRRAGANGSGCPARSAFKGFGVSACATCDGFFFRSKEVVVVGGGNTAVEEALYLANLASKVTVVHRRDSFRAERILQERLFAHPNVEVIWDSAIDEILGTENPAAVTRCPAEECQDRRADRLKMDGVFVAIGHAPAVELFVGQLAMKPNGYIATAPGRTATNIPGVFAAGDVTDEIYRQAVTRPGWAAWPRSTPRKWLPEHAARTRRPRNNALAHALVDALDWDKVRIFYAAAEAGSFTHAGDMLGLSQSAVSRQVGALEQDLGVPLFHRHARGLILTEQGETAVSHRPRDDAEARGARARLTDTPRAADGRAARHHHGRASAPSWLTPRLGEFLDLYPEIRCS